MFRFIFYFFFFGFLFYLIWIFFPEAFNTMLSWANRVYDFFHGLVEKVSSASPSPNKEAGHQVLSRFLSFRF